MNKFFNANNPVMNFLTNLYNIMLLNWLFLLCSLPFFTIGASFSAMYSVAFKIIKDEDPSVIKDFFTSFKSNFRQSTILWIPLFLLTLFFAVDLFIVYRMLGQDLQFFQYPIWILITVILSIIIYAFPLIARYESSTKEIIRNSILLSIANFPTTIFILAIQYAIGYIAAGSAKSLVMTGSLFLFFACAGLACFYSLFFNRIFDKCDEKKDLDN